MDTRIYRSILAPFLESCTTYHYNVPCPNLVCTEKLIEVSKNCNSSDENYESRIEGNAKRFDVFPFYKSFKYETDSCTVLYPGWTKTDKAHDYVFRKLLWYKKVAHYMPRDVEKGINWLKKNKIMEAENVDKKLLKFLHWLSFEQDDKFIGNYNWLYTGGNIGGFKYNDEYWLVTPDEFKQSTFLCIIKLNSNFHPLWDSNKRPMRISLRQSQPVYQIISKPRTDEVFLAVRHKDWISIKKLNNSCETMDIWDLKTFKRNPCSDYLTTCDLSEDCRYLSVVSSDSDMVVFNVEVEMPIFSWKQHCDFMQWSRILFNNVASEVFFADPRSFKIFDLRSEIEPIFTYRPTAVSTKCERISNFFGSEFRENIFYIATSHALIEMDIRTGKNIQRWTHMMEHAPQFGGTCRRNDKELIILQSQDPNEIVGIHNEGLYDKFAYSRSSPYLFSSVKDGLRKAHLNGFGLHEKIRQRLNFYITGLHVAMSSEGRNTIFTINGGGDLVMTKLKNREPDNMEKETDCFIPLNSQKGFQNFERRCCDLQTEKCEYRAVPPSCIDVSRLLTIIEKMSVQKRRRRKVFKGLSDYWKNSKTYSPENLAFREGGFYERFLPYWEIKLKSVEDEEATSGNENEDEKLRESRAKVEDWMN